MFVWVGIFSSHYQFDDVQAVFDNEQAALEWKANQIKDNDLNSTYVEKHEVQTNYTKEPEK